MVARLFKSLFLTVPQLALAFNRSDRTIRDWLGKWRQKIRQDGSKYYLPDIIRCFEENFGIKKRADSSKIKDALNLIKLEKEKLELEALRRKYVEREKIEMEWATRASEFKQSLLALEFRLATILADKSGKTIPIVRQILKKEVLELLQSYCREGKYIPVITDNLPIHLQEEALSQFWQKIQALPTKKYKKIVVEVKGKIR